MADTSKELHGLSPTWAVRVAAARDSSEHGIIRVVRREAGLHGASTRCAGLELRVDVVNRATVRHNQPIEPPGLPEDTVQERAVCAGRDLTQVQLSVSCEPHKTMIMIIYGAATHAIDSIVRAHDRPDTATLDSSAPGGKVVLDLVAVRDDRIE